MVVTFELKEHTVDGFFPESIFISWKGPQEDPGEGETVPSEQEVGQLAPGVLHGSGVRGLGRCGWGVQTGLPGLGRAMGKGHWRLPKGQLVLGAGGLCGLGRAVLWGWGPMSHSQLYD